jgi:hypothetical protein
MHGTLHALCHRALDAPPIAETKTTKGGWNSTYPHYAMPQSSLQDSLQDSLQVHGIADPSGDDPLSISLGQRRLHDYNVWRSVTCGEGILPEMLEDFVRCWEDWKTQSGLRDFTDLLLDALQVLPRAPGNPALLIADEAQDFTPLQWRLLQQWSRYCARWIVAGDDDQALYTWCGASPQPMLEAAEHDKIILEQSYRLPATIYAHAVTYLARITQRQDKRWAPRPHPGSLTSLHLPLAQVAQQAIMETLRGAYGAEHTCMALAPCSYMLEGTIRWLRAEGIPFANPWRLKRGDWNPLASRGRGISSRTRLLDFLRPPGRLWTWPELRTWLPSIREKGTLNRKHWKSLLDLHEDEQRVCTLEECQGLFLPEALNGALSGSLEWLTTRLLADKARGMAYPIRIVERFGREALARDPRIFIGTCHSVKGAEADTVVLSTALSRRFAEARAWGGESADGVERMLYVGATRARERLIVTDQP